MTSKALEAARDELRLVLKYKTQSTSDAQLDLCVRDIIRAFAQNISEEAADIVGVEIHERDRRGFDVFPAYEKTGGQYTTYGRSLTSLAIQKDLE